MQLEKCNEASLVVSFVGNVTQVDISKAELSFFKTAYFQSICKLY